MSGPVDARSDQASLSGIRRLYKTREGLLIDGVCAGLASYLGIRVTAVRVAFILLALAGLWGGVLYLLAMVFIPRSPDQTRPASTAAPSTGAGGIRVVGYALMIFGAILLLDQIGLYQWRFWRVWRIGFHFSWPLFVVLAGWALAARAETDAFPSSESAAGPSAPGLVRRSDERMLAGVCSGVAARWRVDVSAVRVLWAFLTVLSWGVGALAYGLLVLVLPAERTGMTVEAPGPAPGVPEKVDPGSSKPPDRVSSQPDTSPGD